MLFKRKNSRDEIPTLHDVVEDEAVKPAVSVRAPDSDEGTAAAEERPIKPDTSVPATRAQSRAAFEAAIENLVGEILNRHMQNAREEITRAVLTELRARLRRDERAKAD